MHKYLGHRSTAHIHILNLLWRYVLPLSQLEDVLLPVNNLQNSTLVTKQITDITFSCKHTSETVGNSLSFQDEYKVKHSQKPVKLGLA